MLMNYYKIDYYVWKVFFNFTDNNSLKSQLYINFIDYFFICEALVKKKDLGCIRNSG